VIAPEAPDLVLDPALLMGPLNADQSEPRLGQVVRAQRDEALVLDPAAALQRLLRRSRQIVVPDRREYTREPVQRVHVPLEERLRHCVSNAITKHAPEKHDRIRNPSARRRD